MTGSNLGRNLWHAVVALTAMAIVAGSTVYLVKMSAGDFASTYQVTGLFKSAGEGLHPGSQVDERGVAIGTVKSVSLSRGFAKIVMAIGDQYKLPQDVLATIRSQNLFGAEQVVMTFPRRPAATLLQSGATITNTRVETQLGQLFATATPLLNKLDTTSLASVIAELAQASQGQGPAIKASFEEGTRLADLLARTSVAQLRALDAFARFTNAIASIGPSINGINANNNVALPLFVRSANAYRNLLGDISALSDHVSALLVAYRPDIGTIINAGGNITRVLIADQPQLEQVITGLYQYAQRFGNASNGASLPDGTHFGYFKTFIEWIDVEKLVCGLIAPAVPGLSFLAPLQQAVTQVGGPLNCSSQIKQFNAVQAHPGLVPPRKVPNLFPVTGGATLPVPVPSAATPGNLQATARRLAQQLYTQIAAPQQLAPTSMAAYFQSLLGTG